MKLASILLMLIALTMAAVRADTIVYKWVDKDGNVHYSTVPQNPNAKPTQIINTAGDRAPSASSAPAASTANQVPLISPNDSPACKAAKQELGKYMTAQALYSVDAKGDKLLLTKEKQQQLIQQTRNQVTLACTPAGTTP
ncbi:MAG: DUF4124 domain-containing protein [Gammaproteobacteria bacterium]|nr:DUF4124 domain-containing protein [Gammaproteobacteria bacterium]MDE2346681.1 DUF4124 domain-containing protein [Gammaproteobacteria bacterium]